MSLVVLTGAVRSGKSAAAERLALTRGVPVVVAVAGWGGDEEMARRIAAHEADRPASWTTIAATTDPAWLADVPPNALLVLDCLGTLVSNACYERVGEAEIASAAHEAAVHADADAIASALISRSGDTIVVTNEAGWGIVPAWPSARIFRDAVGRANRTLIDAADAAYLVIDGRFLDLHALPQEPAWPSDESDANRD